MLILRHAWLNLWDKHMTTGRINQVSKNQSPVLSHWQPNLQTNLHSLKNASCRTWAQRILLSSHLFKQPQPRHAETHAINRSNLTKQQAVFHSLQLDAKLGIHQKYKYKLSNTLQVRRPAGMRRLYPPIRARRSTRGDNWNAKLKHFFNAKTYTSEATSTFALITSSAASRNMRAHQILLTAGTANPSKFRLPDKKDLGEKRHRQNKQTSVAKQPQNSGQSRTQKHPLTSPNTFESIILPDAWTRQQKRPADALARRFTLSQNGYGAYKSSRGNVSPRQTYTTKKKQIKLRLAQYRWKNILTKKNHKEKSGHTQSRMWPLWSKCQL